MELREKVGCMVRKTSTEESWILDKAVSNLNLKIISLQNDQREIEIARGGEFSRNSRKSLLF